MGSNRNGLILPLVSPPPDAWRMPNRIATLMAPHISHFCTWFDCIANRLVRSPIEHKRLAVWVICMCERNASERRTWALSPRKIDLIQCKHHEHMCVIRRETIRFWRGKIYGHRVDRTYICTPNWLTLLILPITYCMSDSCSLFFVAKEHVWIDSLVAWQIHNLHFTPFMAGNLMS